MPPSAPWKKKCVMNPRMEKKTQPNWKKSSLIQNLTLLHILETSSNLATDPLGYFLETGLSKTEIFLLYCYGYEDATRILDLWNTNQVWHPFPFCAFLKNTSTFSFIILLPKSCRAPEITVKTLWSFVTRISLDVLLWVITHHDGKLEMRFRVNFPFSFFLSFKMTPQCELCQCGFECRHVFTSIVKSFWKEGFYKKAAARLFLEYYS